MHADEKTIIMIMAISKKNSKKSFVLEFGIKN